MLAKGMTFLSEETPPMTSAAPNAGSVATNNGGAAKGTPMLHQISPRREVRQKYAAMGKSLM